MMWNTKKNYSYLPTLSITVPNKKCYHVKLWMANRVTAVQTPLRYFN